MHIIYRFSLAVTVGLSLGLLLSFSGALREPVSHDKDIYSTQEEILGAIQKKYIKNPKNNLIINENIGFPRVPCGPVYLSLIHI